MKITSVFSRQVLDSRGNPTVETDITIDNKYLGRAIVPSGASTGKYEAIELRDNDKNAYHGLGVNKAVSNVNSKIKDLILNTETINQKEFDNKLIEFDGSINKENLGANAILSVSLAYAWALSKANNIDLYMYIADLYGNKNPLMPRGMFNIMNGGKHANWATDIQEYMIMPLSTNTWKDSLRVGSEVFHSLEKLLKINNYSINVGNEGGFAPNLKSNNEALDLILQAIENSGYKIGEDIKICFDAAASEFYNDKTGNYDLKRDNKSLSKKEMVDWVIELANKYPVFSLEDMFSQDDWESWIDLTSKIGNKYQIVGDDLLVTNTKKIEEAINRKACNSLLVKLNQIGTLTETLNAMKLSEKAGWTNVVSHRSGETEDVTISHLVVGTNALQIKSGAPSRSERVAKFNELLRIEEKLLN